MDYSDCPVRIAIDILSSSWNAWLILEISKGTVRPCDLQRSISVAPKRVLTKQLGELERMGILEKKVYPYGRSVNEWNSRRNQNRLQLLRF